jgi:8-amino-7-oxononanoate synthase
MNYTPIYERIERSLTERKSQSMFRSVKTFKDQCAIDLSTNSYLGLHTIPKITEEAARLACRTGVVPQLPSTQHTLNPPEDVLECRHNDKTFCGNLASRLVAEYSSLYTSVEQEIAEWEGTESALVFSSGYAANVGIIQAICNRDTEVFCDRLNHASIYDGIALSGCKLIRYRHNDMTDLKIKLSGSHAREKLIITDTIFSMDGDRALLADIVDLAQKNSAMVMVDEAHATGIFGDHGTGLVESTGTQDYIDIRMGTLSKALAGLGGYFAGPKFLCDYFVNFSRSLIYSTGLPQATLAFTLASIRYIRKNPGLGLSLLTKSDQFRKQIQEAGFSTLDSTTQIIPCIVRSKDEALVLSSFLKDKGISAPAIRPPTVPEGLSRIRISYHLGLSKYDEDMIIEQLKQWKKLHD